jgi:hypothetical protein
MVINISSLDGVMFIIGSSETRGFGRLLVLVGWLDSMELSATLVPLSPL